MTFARSFPGQVAIALVVICGIASYPLLTYYPKEVIVAAATGAALAAINVMLGYAAVEYSIRKSANTFLFFVLGGMGARMFVLAGILVMLIAVAKMQTIPLITSLGIFYTVFLALEVMFVHKKMSMTKQEEPGR
ncbi:MAG TPA: hypothetical protein VKS81_09920 [Bacteroidota bacterium]|nr:hypothetical protein [Bacteroidota bacterium]